MKKIPLSQHVNCKNKKEKQFALVDDDLYETLNKYNWHLVKSPHTYYAQRYDGEKNIKMHREILSVTDPDILVDHKDHNGLNNQKINLRQANNSQSNQNRRTKKNAVSKYLGVTWHTRKRGTKKWVARIRVNKTLKELGYFYDELSAAKAYDEAAKKYFGEFANLNFK